MCVPDTHHADPYVVYSDVRILTAGTDEPLKMNLIKSSFVSYNKCADKTADHNRKYTVLYKRPVFV